MGEFDAGVPEDVKKFVAPDTENLQTPDVRFIRSEDRSKYIGVGPVKKEVSFKPDFSYERGITTHGERADLIFKYGLPEYMTGSSSDIFKFYDMLSEVDSESAEVAKEIIATIRDLPETQFKVMNYLMNEYKISDWPKLLQQRFFESKIKAFSKMPSGDANWGTLILKAKEFFGAAKEN